MNFDNFSDFLLMDGHALYVWLSYGMGLFIILLTYIQPVLARKSIIQELSQRQRREAKASETSSVETVSTHENKGAC